MDTIEEITLSKIAAILTRDDIFKIYDNSTWERILSIAGQSKLFNRFEEELRPYIYKGTWKNPNPQFDECYTAINRILKTLYIERKSKEELYLLIDSIVKEFELRHILLESYIDEVYESFGYHAEEIQRELADKSPEIAINFILGNAKSDLLDFRKCLHILNLDLTYEKNKLGIKPFNFQGALELERKDSILLEWLKVKNPIIADLYIEALENYIAGNSVSCISICRNIIVGICEGDKEDETKWLKGLQKISTDTYIQHVQVPKNIIDNSANRALGINNGGFNFARFKLIYYLYSLSSDLGSHTSEGPKIDGVVHTEVTSLEDALWILRMTEDFLLWYKQTIANKENAEFTLNNFLF